MNATLEQSTAFSAPDHSRKRLWIVAFGGASAQVFGMGAGLAALTLMQQVWGDDGVGYYTQFRRFSGVFVPLLILGQNIGLTRFVAMAHNDPLERMRLSFVCSLVTLVLFSAVALFCAMFSEVAASWLLGSDKFKPIMAAFALALVGKGCGEVGGAYLRGRFKYITVQFISMVFSGGLTFFLLLILHELAVLSVLLIIGAVQFSVGFGFVAYFLVRGLSLGRLLWAEKSLFGAFVRLYRYGILRLPAIGLAMLLVSFSSWHLAGLEGLSNLGFFNCMLALAMALNIAAVSMSFTLIPLVTLRLQAHGVEGTRGMVSTLLAAAATLGGFLAVQFFFFGSSVAKVLLQRWEEVPLAWGIIYGLVFGLIMYNVTDRVLNALTSVPYSAIGLSVGVAGMYSMWWLSSEWSLDPIVRVGMAVALGYSLMGVVSAAITAKLFKVFSISRGNCLGVLFCGLFGLVALMEWHWTRGREGEAYLHLACLVTNVLMFLGVMWRFRIDWFMHVLNRS